MEIKLKECVNCFNITKCSNYSSIPVINKKYYYKEKYYYDNEESSLVFICVNQSGYKERQDVGIENNPIEVKYGKNKRY